MKTLAIVLWSVFIGASAVTATYELSVLPDERDKLYTEEATASAYYAQLKLSSRYLAQCIERLEEHSAELDHCERSLMTCVGVKP